jgi:hypothetical protein
MTTSPASARDAAATRRRRWRTALRSGLDRRAALRVGVTAGSAALLFATGAALLVLDNVYGPMAEVPRLALPAALGVGLAVATGVGVLVTRSAQRSVLAMTAVLGVLLGSGWVLVPRQVDVHESWVPRPNERHSCTGWAFRHYPPGTYDASAVTYCIGLETRIADG